MMRRNADPLRHPERLIRRVYAYVAYRIGDGADAEDVTGEVFERAVRYRASFDPDRGEPIGWLLTIARRCIADHVARARPEPLLDDGRGPSEWIEDRALERLELGHALARLGERDRELIALRYGADLSARRIADVVGMETNAVEVALHRARARLREELEHDRRDAPAALDARARRAAN